VSELKSISGSSRLPYGTLALGAEGIKNAIKSFDDACVAFPPLYSTLYSSSSSISDFRTCLYHRRKSDIDNERLPPIEERPPPTSSPSFSPSTNGGTGTGLSTTKGISAGAGVGTTNAVLGTNDAIQENQRRKVGIGTVPPVMAIQSCISWRTTTGCFRVESSLVGCGWFRVLM
jgi:hypothetical protein